MAIKTINMNDIQILGIIIIGGVLGLGFLGLAIHMSLDKTPRTYIPKPPIWLNNKNKKNDTSKRNKTR